MSGEVIILSTKDGEASESAANFLAIIAFPEPNEQEQRVRFSNCLQSHALQTRANENHEWAHSPQFVRPFLLFQDPGRVARQAQKGMMRIYGRRLPAVNMMMGLVAREEVKRINPRGLASLVNEAVGTNLEELRLNCRVVLSEYDPLTDEERKRTVRITVNSMAEKMAESLNKEPPVPGPRQGQRWTRESVIRRIWSPTKPVLHLAFAVRRVLTKRFEGNSTDLIALLRGDWLADAVSCAEDIRHYLITRSDRSFRFNEGNLIEVRLK